MRERPFGLAALRHLAKRTGEFAAFPFVLGGDADWLLVHGARVKTLVCRFIPTDTSYLEVVCIGNIADLVSLPSNVRRRVDIHDRIESGRLYELDRSIPDAPSSESNTLIIYATAGLVSIWERIEEDLDLCFNRGYRRIILALSTDKFRPLDFAGHSYLLSVLLNSFPRIKFSTKLEVYVAPPVLHQKGRPLFRFIRILGEEARQKILRSWYWISRAQAPSPMHFSALIVSVQPRRSPDIPTLK
jgi:hypothetical protein